MQSMDSDTCSLGSQLDQEELDQEASSGLQQRPTLYTILGVSITASAEAIRSAYRKLARLWHPDRHYGDEDAKKKFQEVQGAYEVLSDRDRRYEYDLNLLELLDVEEYLSRYQGLILTACGLGMASRTESDCSSVHSCEPGMEDLSPCRPRGWQLLKAS